ncbi:MAG: hypothetical protein NTZ10_00330, partial [Candidatus Saganbacteria bacterium]|nr:hypothetical protein [Candidatus Saganbacteria bacterium]
MDLRELSSYIINKLDCDAEVFCVRSNSLLIESRDQKVTLINKGTELGISLRVIKDGKAGFSFSSGGDPDDLIKRTLDISAIFPYDENNIFPGPSP